MMEDKLKKTTQEVEVQEQSNKVMPLSNSDFVTEIATNIAKEIKEVDKSTLAHVSITRENSLTTITLDGNKVHGVRRVTFTQEAGGLPILNLQLVCEQVSIDSPCLMHIPAIYRNRMSHKD